MTATEEIKRLAFLKRQAACLTVKEASEKACRLFTEADELDKEAAQIEREERTSLIDARLST